MSAIEIPIDWRYTRAVCAIRSGVVLDFAHYAEVFDTDEDEVLEIFHAAACDIGARINVSDDHTAAALSH
jgi:hypothetical protein